MYTLAEESEKCRRSYTYCLRNREITSSEKVRIRGRDRNHCNIRVTDTANYKYNVENEERLLLGTVENLGPRGSTDKFLI